MHSEHSECMPWPPPNSPFRVDYYYIPRTGEICYWVGAVADPTTHMHSGLSQGNEVTPKEKEYDTFVNYIIPAGAGAVLVLFIFWSVIKITRWYATWSRLMEQRRIQRWEQKEYWTAADTERHPFRKGRHDGMISGMFRW